MTIKQKIEKAQDIISSLLFEGGYEEDEKIMKKAPQMKETFHLKEEVLQTVQQINAELREGSDVWGALTKEWKKN